ncbi:MAG: hypothetical protein ABI663_01100 [Chryseolinea sp.]
MKTILCTVLFLLSLIACFPSFAALMSEGNDSTIEKKKEYPIHFRLTTRLHSKGMFMYGGQLGTDNPTFDVNFTLEYKKWGLLIFKGIDLQDHTSDYNFALLSVFRNFKISEKITFTPYIGTFLEQPNHFADEGSDAVCILITSFKLRPHFTFEHMALFGNLVFEPSEMDWVNRFRLSYTNKHLDIIASVWHNNNVFDHSSYVTSALNVAYSRMKVAKQIFLSVGVTGMTTLHTSDEEENPSKDRVMFTLAAQWVH